MIAFNVSTLRIATALALVTTGLAAHATNGINLIGFGAESTLMGGADVAVARDTSALNTNPAGLTQIKAPLLDMFGSVLRTTDLVHKDPRNEEHASNRYTLLGGGGYARPLENMPCTAGIGLFAQGGAGGVFDNLRTPFGNRDDLSSLFGIAKIIPGIGCEVTDKLSLGASLNIVYASIEQDFFCEHFSECCALCWLQIRGRLRSAYWLQAGHAISCDSGTDIGCLLYRKNRAANDWRYTDS